VVTGRCTEFYDRDFAVEVGVVPAWHPVEGAPLSDRERVRFDPLGPEVTWATPRSVTVTCPPGPIDDERVRSANEASDSLPPVAPTQIVTSRRAGPRGGGIPGA
jgi:hypothetical protein